MRFIPLIAVPCLFVSLFSFSFVPVARAGMAGCTPGKVSGHRASYRSFKTGYFPDSSTMEGGFEDRNGRPLRTLQAYLRGQAEYVSVAMDHTDGRLPYGTVVRIPDLEKHFGRCIEFRIVDTGGRFKGRGTDKIDICNDNEGHANSGFSNGWSHIYVMGKGAKVPNKPGKEEPEEEEPEEEEGEEEEEEGEEEDSRLQMGFSPADFLQDSIVNGTLANGSEAFVSSVVGLTDDEDVLKLQSSCTATLISDRLAVTAAHCKPKELSHLLFGLQVNSNMQKRPIVHSAVHYAYSRNSSSDRNDIALLEFSGGLPKGYRPIPILPDYKLLKVGTEVVMAGSAMYESESTVLTAKKKWRPISETLVCAVATLAVRASFLSAAAITFGEILPGETAIAAAAVELLASPQT